MGKNPLITRFFKEIYNSRPPVPRYVKTWDPATILAYFDSHASASLSLIQLARKTATLLALTTILRCSELTSIQKQSVIITETEALFVLGNPRKAQKSGALHKISVRSWMDNKAICPANCLEQYLEATRPHRYKDNESQLFIGANKPHRLVDGSIWIWPARGGIDLRSLNETETEKHVLYSVAQICPNKHDKLKLAFMKVQQQKDGFHCGLFAIANENALAFQLNPCEFLYRHSELRSHFIIRTVVIGKCCHSQLCNLENVKIGGLVFIFDVIYTAAVKCRSTLMTLDSLKDLGQLFNAKAAITGTIQTANKFLNP